MDPGDAHELVRASDADVPPGLEHPRLEPRPGIRALVEALDLLEVGRREQLTFRRVVPGERARIDEPELQMQNGIARRNELGSEGVQ